MKQVEDLKTLSGPVYDCEKDHHYNEIQKHMIELKQMTGPVYNAEHKHHYERDHYTPTDSAHLVGPVYQSERSSYGHDFHREHEKKDLSGPVYELPRKHQYGKDWSVKFSDVETGGQIRPIDNKHHFKHPINLPHQRDLATKKP